jgi:hypothetical protein
MGRVIAAVIAVIATLIAVVHLLYAGALFLYAVGVTGDVGYDNDWRVVLAISGMTALIGALFAILAVAALRSALKRPAPLRSPPTV